MSTCAKIFKSLPSCNAEKIDENQNRIKKQVASRNAERAVILSEPEAVESDAEEATDKGFFLGSHFVRQWIVRQI